MKFKLIYFVYVFNIIFYFIVEYEEIGFIVLFMVYFNNIMKDIYFLFKKGVFMNIIILLCLDYFFK